MDIITARESLSMEYHGGDRIVVRQTVTSGPKNLVGRTVLSTLTFDQIDKLSACVKDCRARLEESNKRISDIACRNTGEEE